MNSYRIPTHWTWSQHSLTMSLIHNGCFPRCLDFLVKHASCLHPLCHQHFCFLGGDPTTHLPPQDSDTPRPSSPWLLSVVPTWLFSGHSEGTLPKPGVLQSLPVSGPTVLFLRKGSIQSGSWHNIIVTYWPMLCNDLATSHPATHG